MNTIFRCLLVLLPLMLASSVAIAQEDIFTAMKGAPGSEWVADEIIVKFKSGVDEQTIERTNRRFRTERKRTSRRGKSMRLRFSGQRRVAALIADYLQQPEVEYAEPNYLATAHEIPNDSYYPLQWNLNNPVYGGINMEQAWGINSGNQNVIVAVIDTGVAYENYRELVGSWFQAQVVRYAQAPDLANTYFVEGYDFVNDDTHPNDDQGHGTHVTGTIAQSTNNGTGVAGIAYDTAIMPIKVLDDRGSGTYSAIADGIYYAADNGAKVINLSLGGPNASRTLENALAYAYDKGVTIVCSAGNDGDPEVIGYPAAYDSYCVAVGATRYDETVSYYSNGGASLDITAPGGDLTVNQNGDAYNDGILQQTFDSNPTSFSYYFYQGTSMAAPHVSGVAALLIASGVATTPDEVRETLQATAKEKGAPGWDAAYGWGILDAAAALNYSTIPNSQPVANAGGPYMGTEDQVMTFDGTTSYDPEEGALTYNWAFGDSANGSGSNPSHTYLSGGVYKVTLVVNDGLENSNPATTTAIIADAPEVPVAPVAVVNGPYSGTVKAPVLFDATGSYASEDTLLTYHWDFGDGTTGNGLSLHHPYLSEGVYSVTLVVSDGSQDSAPVVTTASIEAINEAPVAVVNGAYTGIEGSAVSFDSNGSYDPEDTVLTYSWDFGDGNNSSDSNPIHTYLAGGVYTVTLVVNDGSLDSSSVETTATIEEVNESPVADPGTDRNATAGDQVDFDGSGSSDSDGTIVSYLWNFGDITKASGKTSSHIYRTAGQYTVTLMVTDNQGGTGTGQIAVNVTEPAKQTMYVAEINLVLNKTKYFWFNRYNAEARITILDSNNLPVSGAVVKSFWSGATRSNNSAVTDANGQVTMISDRLVRPSSGTTFVLTVDQVSLQDWVYSAADNVETSDTIKVR